MFLGSKVLDDGLSDQIDLLVQCLLEVKLVIMRGKQLLNGIFGKIIIIAFEIYFKVYKYILKNYCETILFLKEFVYKPQYLFIYEKMHYI